MELVKDNAILLTGSTGRIGAATLAVLAAEGARIGVVSRDRTRARAVIDALPAEQRTRTIPIAADLNDPAAADAAVASCVDAFGRIDALVNLAGAGWRKKAMTDATLDDLRSTLAEVIETAYMISASALRAMLGQPIPAGGRSRGRIVTVSATAVRRPTPGFSAYATAKGAVNAMMVALAREYKGDGIVANAVLLGGVNFPGSEKFRSPGDNAKAVSDREVADVLAFLASDRATGINGALLELNARETD